MNRFNLCFSGEILPGEDPALVRQRFAQLFGIDDQARVEQFFSGKPITLRRNLDRKAAGQCYQDMHKIGAVAQLVKLSASEAADLLLGSAPKDTPEPPAPVAKIRRNTPAAKKRKPRQTTRAKAAADAESAAVQESAKAAQLATQDKTRQAAGQEARRAAKEKAQQKAEQQARRAAEQKAEQEAAQQAQRAEEERAQQKAAQQARRAAQDRARREADQSARQEAGRRAAERAAREAILRSAKAEQAQQRTKTDATADARPPVRSPTRGRVKTRLEVPLRDGARGSAGHRSPVRKRQPGEPNPYALRPFRNTRAVRERAGHALRRARLALLGGALALTLLLLLIGAFSYLQTDQQPLRATAIASDSSGGLTLLAGNALLRHDRSGTAAGSVSAESLGLSILAPPMLFIDDTSVLLGGRSLAAQREGPHDVEHSLQLLRCDLHLSRCSPAIRPGDSAVASAVTHNHLDNSLFVADGASGTVSRFAANGSLLSRAELQMPTRPVIQLHAGLLLMNSPTAPAISVYRYDDSAFGQQLDEVLLLPPNANPEQLRVGDFVWNADNWWVELYDAASGAAGVYRFTPEWRFIDKADISGVKTPLQLTAWKDKVLVNTGQDARIARLNSLGASEVPFVSSALQERIDQRARAAKLTAIGWRGGFALCALLAAFGLALAYLETLRGRVYRGSRAHGAEPVAEYLDRLRWVPPATGRDRSLRHFAIALAVLLSAACLVAIGQEASAWQLAALLTALSGPVLALMIISRQAIGHIGTLDNRLLLVDHAGLYHLGADSRIQYRGAFLLMDDVVVFMGNKLLPAFTQSALGQSVIPLLRGAVKVDRTTLVIKLLQARHPFALAAAACALAGAAGVLFLVLSSPLP